jgi:hypothetical protein
MKVKSKLALDLRSAEKNLSKVTAQLEELQLEYEQEKEELGSQLAQAKMQLAELQSGQQGSLSSF